MELCMSVSKAQLQQLEDSDVVYSFVDEELFLQERYIPDLVDVCFDSEEDFRKAKEILKQV